MPISRYAGLSAPLSGTPEGEGIGGEASEVQRYARR